MNIQNKKIIKRFDKQILFKRNLSKDIRSISTQFRTFFVAFQIGRAQLLGGLHQYHVPCRIFQSRQTCLIQTRNADLFQHAQANAAGFLLRQHHKKQFPTKRNDPFNGNPRWF